MIEMSEWNTNETPSETDVIRSIQYVLDMNDSSNENSIQFHHVAYERLLDNVAMLYRYAFLGRIEYEKEPLDNLFIDAVSDLITVVALQSTLRPLFREFCDFEFIHVPTEMLLIAVIARIKLDSYLGTGYIDIEDCPPVGMLARYSQLPGLSRHELAVLARLSERSVQNDTTESQGRRLEFKDTVIEDWKVMVPMKYVSFEDAHTYLKGKRRYLPTSQNASNIQETIFAR